MTFNEHMLAVALMSARAEKAQMRRMSRKASIRRSLRAIKRQGQRVNGDEGLRIRGQIDPRSC